MVYSSQQASILFAVSRATINNWAREFAQYLSAEASPGGNKNRNFTADDMTVLSLVAGYKNSGRTYPDIHEALHNGERGSVPDTPPSELQPLSPAEKDRRVTLVVDQLQQSLASLKLELAEAQQVAAQVAEMREENIKLKTSLEYTERELAQMRQQLEKTAEQLSRRIEELSMQAGREYAKGFVEGLREHSDPRPRE